MASFLGIDVSSLSLDAAVRPQGIKMHLSNDPAGFETLLESLRKLSIKRVLLEATGGYERDEGVRNFVFGHNMSKRCMYANQKETPA